MTAFLRATGARVASTLAITVGFWTVAPVQGAQAAPFAFSWANPRPQANGLWGSAFEDISTGYAVGEKGTTLRTTDGGVSWSDRTRYADFSKHLYDVLLLGPGDLLAAGEAPGLYRSTDGGEHWAPVANPSTFAMRNLNRFDATTLTAVGDGGQVIRSTDAGASWTALAATGVNELLDQWWRTPQDGYVVGEFRARRTTDGGLSWAPLPGVMEAGVPTFTDIAFLDAQNGWMLEHFTTYRTTDGGASWFKKHGPIPQSPFYQAEMSIVSATERFVVTDLEGAEIWRTTNDGLNWTKQYERNATRGYTDLDRLPDGALVTVSSDGDLLRSTNNGGSWVNFTANPGSDDRFSITRMAFLGNGKAIAGGHGIPWLASTDGGLSWSFTPAAAGIATPWAIEFLNDQFGMAAGYTSGQSRIARTTDGGTTWTSHNIAPSYIGYVHGLAVPDETTQFAAIHGGSGINRVYRSTDGGLTWHPREQGLAGVDRFESIAFLDASTGFVSGEGPGFVARIWATTDGGGTWTVPANAGLSGNTIFDMRWLDPQRGVAAGTGGVFLTTNGGASWVKTLPVGMGDLDFLDDLRGMAAETFDDVVWATNDGGQSWSPIDLAWTGSPEAIAAHPWGFTVCGRGNVIMNATDLSVTGIPDPATPEVPVVAARSRIEVVPNPARATVQLRFSSPAAGTYGVGVFDASGRRVAGFERQAPAGFVSVDWDPRDESGARLAAGHYLLSVRGASGEIGTGRVLILTR